MPYSRFLWEEGHGIRTAAGAQAKRAGACRKGKARCRGGRRTLSHAKNPLAAARVNMRAPIRRSRGYGLPFWGRGAAARQPGPCGERPRALSPRRRKSPGLCGGKGGCRERAAGAAAPCRHQSPASRHGPSTKGLPLPCSFSMRRARVHSHWSTGYILSHASISCRCWRLIR